MLMKNEDMIKCNRTLFISIYDINRLYIVCHISYFDIATKSI